jgi:lysophospholipase L1-like esterase
VICFGANDMGIWLYDSYVPETEELLSKRKVRDDEYILAHEILIDKFNERGIKTVIMTPYAVNSFIKESDAIYTEPDNDEKEDIIKPSFYKRKTFENINKGFMGYSKRLKELCERKGAIFWDMFGKTYEKMLVEDGLFFDDGIHYSAKGHEIIAKIILEFLGCEIPNEFIRTKENDEIFELEQLERSTGYLIRCTPLNPHFGIKTEQEKVEHITKVLNGNYAWGKLSAENYFKYYKQLPELKRKLQKLVTELK